MIDVERVARAAHRIARRLRLAALWDGREATWMITVPSGFDVPIRATFEPAEGDLYQGTAGISLFLAETSVALADPSLRDVALAGIRRAIQQTKSRPAEPIGFYVGATGVAYAALRVGQLLNDAELEDFGRSIGTWFATPRNDIAVDVIAGGAGAVIGLTRLAAWLDDGALRDLALRIGDRLIRVANKRIAGWSWSAGGPFSTQDLAGYAHGASGFAHAFLELYAQSGDHMWRHAALRAIQYERAKGGPREGDWWDFRQPELATIAARPHGLEELRRRAADKESLAVATPSSMRAWCHGSPGISFTRLRAMDLDVDRNQCQQEAHFALNRTIETLSDATRGYSLCHGTFGNAEAIREGITRGLSDGLASLEMAIEEGLDRYDVDGRTWPSGTMNGRPDPSLMLGDAGIGLFLLRLVDATVPSIVFVSASATPVGTRDNGPCGAELEIMMPAFVEYSKRLGVDIRAKTPSLDSVFSADVAFLAGDLTDDHEGARYERLLADAQLPERTRLEADHAYTDYVPQSLLELREPEFPRDWQSARFLLTEHAHIVTTSWAWRDWLRTSQPLPEERFEFYLVFRRARTVCLQPISEITKIILCALRTQRSGEELCNTIRDMFASSEASQGLNAFIRDTLDSVVRARIVRFLS